MLDDLLLICYVDEMADKVNNESGDSNQLVLNQSDKEQTDGAIENGKCKLTDDTDDSDCFGRPGSQIDDKTVFKNKFGERVSAIPVIVDFNRVLQLKHIGRAEGVISGVIVAPPTYIIYFCMTDFVCDYDKEVTSLHSVSGQAVIMIKYPR